MDPVSGRIRLDRMLFTSTRYPADYGFIPGTLAEDGDPVDVMVLLGEPAFPGCMVSVRPVGVSWMSDEHGPDAKVLTVLARDPRYAGLRDLSDVPGHLLDEVGHFFDIHKELEPGKGTAVRSWQDQAAAKKAITTAQARAAGQSA
jgi:inorganic pyrophosphatase